MNVINRSCPSDPEYKPTAALVWRSELVTELVLDLERDAAEQQYYVYLYSLGYTTSWPNYVKGYAPNVSFDYGNRAAALWLER